jgi:hypothetical protein
MGDELVPLTVEEDATQVEHVLGTTAAPAHPRTVESHSQEVAHGPFASAGSDVEIVAPQ